VAAGAMRCWWNGAGRKKAGQWIGKVSSVSMDKQGHRAVIKCGRIGTPSYANWVDSFLSRTANLMPFESGLFMQQNGRYSINVASLWLFCPKMGLMGNLDRAY